MTVFNPIAKCHRSKPLAKIHEIHEKEKKVKYAPRVIDIERSHRWFFRAMEVWVGNVPTSTNDWLKN